MRHMGFVLALGLLLAPAVSVMAQTPSLDELRAQIDANVEQQNGYLDLLSNPDPQRAREAMAVFLASGDPKLMRMALDFGLTSSDPVLQRYSLEGFFNSGPALQLTFDGSGLEDTRGLTADLQALGGSLSGDKMGYANLKLGPPDEKAGCWLWEGSKECGVRLTDAAAAIHFRSYWYPMVLEDGVLHGMSNMYSTQRPVPFTIPVTP